MKTLVLSLILILFIFSISSASDCDSPQYVLSQEGVDKCIIFGEKLEKCEYITQSQDMLITQMQEKMDIKDLAEQKLLQAVDAQQQAINAYKEVIKIKDEETAIKDKQCKEDIKKAKPSFWHQLGLFTEGVVTGITLTIVGAIFLL